MNHDLKLLELIQDYLEERATQAQVSELNSRLRNDPDARRIFRDMLNLDTILAQSLATTNIESQPSLPLVELSESNRLTPITPFVARSRYLWTVPVALAATIAILWLSLVPRMLAPTVMQQGFALVSSTTGTTNLSPGMSLDSAPIELHTGAIEFTTPRGVSVVIEAPALFYLESAERLQLKHGRLAADVPPGGEGFTVVTPTGEVIDLGTKFGVDMPQQGEAELHVFQGEVIAKSTAGDELGTLRDGQAIRLQSLAGAPSGFRSAAFILPGELTSLNAALKAGQANRSKDAVEKLRHDAALIAVIDFESTAELSGLFRTVQGRWPGSQAAEFVNVGDHMKLDVGGDKAWPQLTLAAWVRLDHLGEPYQSLLHTDGWQDSNSGQVHWMVTRLMTMRLALRNNVLAPDEPVRDGFADSQTNVEPEKGRWVHLAAVYDADQKTVRFYFNGKFDNQTRYAETFPARLGPAQIGNWSDSDRTLSGRVDEMLILGRVMSDDEIADLFSAGNPYR